MALDRTWFNALVDDDGSNTIGTVWGKDDIKNLLDSVDAIHNAHCLNRLSAGGIGVASGAWVSIPFDVREADPLGMYVGGGKVRVPAAGVYGASIAVYWAGNAAGTRYTAVAVNGVPYPTYPPSQLPPGAAIFMVRIVELLSLAANAEISAMVYHDIGTNILLLGDTRLHVWRVA